MIIERFGGSGCVQEDEMKEISCSGHFPERNFFLHCDVN